MMRFKVLLWKIGFYNDCPYCNIEKSSKPDKSQFYDRNKVEYIDEFKED